MLHNGITSQDNASFNSGSTVTFSKGFIKLPTRWGPQKPNVATFSLPHKQHQNLISDCKKISLFCDPSQDLLHRRKWLGDIPVRKIYLNICVLPESSQKQKKISSMTWVCSSYWTNDLARVPDAAKRQILMFCVCYSCCSSVIIALAVEMLANTQC